MFDLFNASHDSPPAQGYRDMSRSGATSVDAFLKTICRADMVDPIQKSSLARLKFNPRGVPIPPRGIRHISLVMPAHSCSQQPRAVER